MVVLWIVLGLAAAAVVWWASQVDRSALRDLYHALPVQRRQALGLTTVAAMLLTLRGLMLSVVARDVAVTSTTAGWLLAAIALMLAYHWPRQ